MHEGTHIDDPRQRRDGGWTLVELLVSMTIFIGLLTIVFSILITISWQTRDNLARASQVSQAQIGFAQIDRQIRSGNVILDPAVETLADSDVPPNYSLRVYTQTDGVFQCAQWRVRFPSGGSTGGVLEYRSWKPSWQTTGGVTSWAVVARDLVTDPAGVSTPFRRVTAGAGSSAQSVQVTLWVKSAESAAKSRPSVITSVLTGRNTVFGYPADECAPVPAP